MKGLRLTCTKNSRFLPWDFGGTWGHITHGFYRYQLWEHEVIPVQSTRPNVWLRGKIIHHPWNWIEAKEYFLALAPQYDELDIEGPGSCAEYRTLKLEVQIENQRGLSKNET